MVEIVLETPEIMGGFLLPMGKSNNIQQMYDEIAALCPRVVILNPSSDGC